jgi:hypothetical protein
LKSNGLSRGQRRGRSLLAAKHTRGSEPKLTLVATTVAVAIGLWGARILIAPPDWEAANTVSVPVEQLTLNAPKNLPDFDDSYQRHLGVLDTLKTL